MVGTPSLNKIMTKIYLKLTDSSDFFKDEPHSKKQSSQDHVIVPKTDLRDDNDALNECDGKSKPCVDLIPDMIQIQLHQQN